MELKWLTGWPVLFAFCCVIVLFILVSGCVASCTFCPAPNRCCNGQCLKPCPDGQFRDPEDCLCYPDTTVRCDCMGYKYCVQGGRCCNNTWVTCPAGSFMGVDCGCYTEGTVRCDCGPFTYCKAGGTCCNNDWIICPSGTFLGEDCHCWPVGVVRCNCGGSLYCMPGGQCCNNIWVASCPAGQVMSETCHCIPLR